ncbi:histone chaperone RTT106-like [Papaver somniferum]|uniref:histone chaperone RTT106-like n=1 Tax=Papaver somniferum TaxID=3469 RepID=UPI000E7049BA|nr:histone chaperone RTT106-like [Papaver somniferum]
MEMPKATCMKQTHRKPNRDSPGFANLVQLKRSKKTVEEEEINAAETEEMTRLRKVGTVFNVKTLPTKCGFNNRWLQKEKKKSITPPSRSPRIGDKLLTATYRGAFVEPGMLKIRERKDSQPPTEPSDLYETPDEDQSIPSGRRGNDHDGVERTPAAGGDDEHDDDDQDMPPVGGGNGDGDNNDGDQYNDGQREIVEGEEDKEEEDEEEGREETDNDQQTQDATTTATATGRPDRVINKPSDSHMLPSHLKVQLDPGQPPVGTPEDGGHVLFGYKDI